MSKCLSISLFFLLLNIAHGQNCQLTCEMSVEYSMESSQPVELMVSDVNPNTGNCSGPFTIHLEDDEGMNIGNMVTP